MSYQYFVKQEIFDIVISDLQKKPPKIILIDNKKQNLYPNKKRFDYIKFFSQDPRFRKFFKNYRHFGVIDHFVIFIR